LLALGAMAAPFAQSALGQTATRISRKEVAVLKAAARPKSQNNCDRRLGAAPGHARERHAGRPP
jgi:hypothetical protein